MNFINKKVPNKIITHLQKDLIRTPKYLNKNTSPKVFLY